MAASIKKKVHVEYQSSDSEYDADSDVSVNDLDDDDELPDDNDVPKLPGKTGLADVMSKILKKQIPVHKQVILAKAKTDKELRKRKEAEEEQDENDEKPAKKIRVKEEEGENAGVALALARQEKLRLWENMCRSKPDPLDRPKERALQRVATRGVVQLFNAVRQQQKQIQGEMTEVGTSERKKDKILQGMTKDRFLNILKGTSATNIKVEKEEPQNERVKKESETGNEEKRWNILRDDFMMGAKMKDWNKESSDDDDEEGPGDPGMSDSD